MTEKRFTIGNVLTKCSGLRDNGKLMTFNEVVDLLNEQHEEIEKLKSEINMLKTTISRNEAYIERLTHKGEWR